MMEQEVHSIVKTEEEQKTRAFWISDFCCVFFSSCTNNKQHRRRSTHNLSGEQNRNYQNYSSFLFPFSFGPILGLLSHSLTKGTMECVSVLCVLFICVLHVCCLNYHPQYFVVAHFFALPFLPFRFDFTLASLASALVCVKKNRRVIGNDLINEIGFVIYIVFFCVRFLSLIAEMSETGGRLYETHCVTLVIATHCSLLSVFWALRKRPCNVISWRGKKFFDHKSFPSCNSMPSCSLHRTSGSIR